MVNTMHEVAVVSETPVVRVDGGAMEMRDAGPRSGMRSRMRSRMRSGMRAPRMRASHLPTAHARLSRGPGRYQEQDGCGNDALGESKSPHDALQNLLTRAAGAKFTACQESDEWNCRESSESPCPILGADKLSKAERLDEARASGPGCRPLSAKTALPIRPV